MKLQHIRKRSVKNIMFRVVKELDAKMYPLGKKEEMKYVEELSVALNNKYSKVKIANMLRRIMSYVLLTNSPVFVTAPLVKMVVKTISEKEVMIIANYIIVHNQYIAKLNRSLTQKTYNY